MKKSILCDKSFDFALAIVKLSKDLQASKEITLSRQILKSGTSVEANIREAQNAESRKDFIHKLSISQKNVMRLFIGWIC